VIEGRGVKDTTNEGEGLDDVDGLKVELKVKKDEAVPVNETVAEEDAEATEDSVVYPV